MRPRYARGAVEVRSWCGRCIRSWCGRGTLVRFQYAHRCGSGAVLHFNFLSGGTVIVGGASKFIRIIGDPDNRGLDNRGSTVCLR